MEQSQFSYQIVRSSRKTIAIQITPDGQVLVRCPRRMKLETIRRFVLEKTPWILRHLAQIEMQPTLPPLTASELQDLTARAKAALPPLVEKWAKVLGVDYGRITIRHQRSLWGSCSAQGNLNFNCLVMLMPAEVREYIVVHELCHRREMNHSAAFWAQVEQFLPDYPRQRFWLREHGASLIARLPRPQQKQA